MDNERTQTGHEQIQVENDQTQAFNDPNPKDVPSELEVLKIYENQGQKDTGQPQNHNDHAKIEEEHAKKHDEGKSQTNNQSEEKIQANNKSEEKPPTNNQNDERPPTNNQSEDKAQTNKEYDAEEPPKASLISPIVLLLVSVTGFGVFYAVHNRPGTTDLDPTSPTNNNNVVDTVNVVVPDPVNVNDNDLIQDPLPITRLIPFKIGVIVVSVIVVASIIAVGVYLYQLSLEQERFHKEEEERLRLEKELEEQRQRELEERLQLEQEEERRREAESRTFKGYMVRIFTKQNILIASFVAGILMPHLHIRDASNMVTSIFVIVATGWYLGQVQAFLIVTAWCTTFCGLCASVTVNRLRSTRPGARGEADLLFFLSVIFAALGYLSL